MNIKHLLLTGLNRIGYPSWKIFPQIIQFDTLNYCNADCVYCNVKQDGAFKVERGRMDTDVFIDALKLLKPYSRYIEYISLFMNGEPLLDERLQSFLYLIKEYGYRGIIDTNGILTRKAEVLIHPAMKTVRVSLSAHTRWLYKEVHGVDEFLQVKKTLEYLRDNLSGDQELCINHMVCKQNEVYIEDFLEEFKDYVIQVFPLHYGLNQVNSLDNYSELLDSQYRVYPDGRRVDMLTPLKKYMPCPCWNILPIGLNGELMHCTDYPATYNYGNIYNSDIKKMWDTRNHYMMDHPLCQKCSLRFK